MHHFFYRGKDAIDTLGIGVFDGLHKGHQAIIDQCSHIMTFWPHPLVVLRPGHVVDRLTVLTEMRALCTKVFALSFTHHIALLPAEQFFYDIIVQTLKPRRIVVGVDFRFGHQKSGTIDQLKTWGQKWDMSIVTVSLVKDNHQFIKSGRIRQTIQKGHFSKALHLLNHDYPISGTVITGDKRGRQLGFPTANLALPKEKLCPQPGVYSGTVPSLKKKAIVYIGTKPTFHDTHQHVEVHILDYDGNLYHQPLLVLLNAFIRPEQTFASPAALAKQIKQDCATIN